MPFESDVFINCPFDDEFAPLLESMLFCIVYAGLQPRLATERLEGGENRLDKIFSLACAAKYSIHDLSRCKSSAAGEFARLNMPFELGLDLGIRLVGSAQQKQKKFLIFEDQPYETKRSLSDLGGQDVAWHKGKYEEVIRKTRDFLSVEAAVAGLPGASRLKAEYETWQGWMTEKKIFEGHTAKEAMELPTSERLGEMQAWIQAGKPTSFPA